MFIVFLKPVIDFCLARKEEIKYKHIKSFNFIREN